MTKQAIILHDLDNVATAVVDLAPGDVLETGRAPLTVVEAVPFGHKIALRDIAAGVEVIKYGESIGVAMRDIPAGTCAHVQNVESQRGRGDLAESGR